MKVNIQRRRLMTAAVLLVAVSTVVLAGVANATNPIITNRFVADPSAHVFNNRVYLYDTDDQTNSGTYWDSKDWRAYSSADLVNWTDNGQVFAVPSGFTWASADAWAPTAATRNGVFYLYLPVDRTKIGVAKSSSPSGPFTDALGKPLIDKARDANAGDEPIDPEVFTDDDGQSYMYFGTRVPKVVKLGADMVSTSGGIQNLSVSGNNYAEAPFLHKRNGVYYFSYSTGWPGQIAYATSSSPMGPFAYRGIILDYTNISTNHQAIFEYQGQWYIVYHRNGLPGGGNYKRSLALEYLNYNSDGTIKLVPQTTAGVTAVPTTGYQTFTGRASGKRAGLNGASTANAAAVVQKTVSAGAIDQQWQLTSLAGGYLNLVNRNSGKCLDVTARSTADGASVIQYACGTGTNQQWQITSLTGGYVRLVARHSGKCLDVKGAGTADGVALVQNSCGTGTSQQWKQAAAG